MHGGLPAIMFFGPVRAGALSVAAVTLLCALSTSAELRQTRTGAY